MVVDDTDSKNKSDPGGSLFLSLELDLKVKAFLDATRTNAYARAVRDARPLEVRVLATVTTWIELSSTNRVGVLSNNFRSFFAERTDVCHRDRC